MRRQIVLTLATGSLLAGMLGAAAPAGADDGPAAPASTWDVPNVKGAVLQSAVDDFRSAAGAVELQFAYDDTKGNRDVINLTNWTVCWQYPKAGSSAGPKVKKISLGVKRLNDKKC